MHNITNVTSEHELKIFQYKSQDRFYEVPATISLVASVIFAGMAAVFHSLKIVDTMRFALILSGASLFIALTINVINAVITRNRFEDKKQSIQPTERFFNDHGKQGNSNPAGGASVAGGAGVGAPPTGTGQGGLLAPGAPPAGHKWAMNADGTYVQMNGAPLPIPL